ncbi:MAG TPA: S8 family serine peptidase, partial [Alphaproteobacteria bacterium]|nr:S8 family serine peptidase [Alphaproteobacteria bacterium]
ELLQMAAQGQTFFYASGDGLAYVGAINSLTDDPYVTSVGGTKLDTTTNGTWKSEVVWNNGNGTNGSSGGVSTFYSIPIWQQNVNMSANGGSTTFRNIPDVAMVGDNCYFFWNNGDQGGWWGTSIASPLWAGFTALVNQQAASQGLPPVGLLNPAIYNIAGGPLYASCFHDIISGNNTNRFSNNEFFAQPGYDLCTGWGSPGTNLISALVSYGGTVWVDFNYTGTTQIGTFNAPFSTLAQATSAVPFGGNIWIRSAGSSRETMKISKSMSIHAYNGAATVGN